MQQKKNNQNIIIGANLRSSGSWDIVVFSLVAYLLNMICLILQSYRKLHIYEISYKFNTVLYQFLETETSDRCFICIL